MKRNRILDTIPTNIDIWGGIDIIGRLPQLFSKPEQVPGCLFLLCTRGECSVMVNQENYELAQGSLVVLIPDVFFQIISHSKDCRFIFVGFSAELIHSARLFPYTIEFTPLVFNQPVKHLQPKAMNLLRDSFMLVIRMRHLSRRLVSKEQATITFIQLVTSLKSLFRAGRPKLSESTRKNDMVREVIRFILTNYTKHRNLSFYAEQLHVSPQHLSANIKLITGKTMTDLIATLIIYDAKAKLCSTDLTVQEIAYSLNFRDISFFGKYFKRYTGMSPKQYRLSEQK